MNVTREQYNLWKHDPVTKVLLQFLTDKRKYLIDFASEQWVGGSNSFAEMNQTVRGQVIELGEIVELPFEAIEEFYRQQENDGTEPQSTER